MIAWGEFATRLIMAFFLGTAIGMEKKWRKAIKSVKISTLLCVSVTAYSIAINNSIVEANFIILGISLICASIILQKKADVLSIDSAISLWCAGMIGLLIGSGFFLLAYGSTLAIMGAKLIFSAEELNSLPKDFVQNEPINSVELEQLPQQIIDEPIETVSIAKNYYHCQIICDLKSEANVLASMVQSVQEQNIILTGLQSNNQSSSQVEISADFVTNNDHHQVELQTIFQSIKSQVGVNSVSWHQAIDK